VSVSGDEHIGNHGWSESSLNGSQTDERFVKRGEFNLNAETSIQSVISGPREISLVRPPGSNVGVQPVLDSNFTPSLTSGLEAPTAQELFM